MSACETGHEAQALRHIAGSTHLVTLLGKPTRHSLSPAIHNLSFSIVGIDAVYLCLDIEPSGLPVALEALRSLDGWDGANVTMPYKQAVVEHLDGLERGAALVGAVNVIKKENGRLIGYNTDGSGFMASLGRQGVQVRDARMVLLGPGGAGSAILAQAALDGMRHIDVFARAGGPSACHAGKLAGRLAGSADCTVQLHDFADETALESCLKCADVLVNATSIGMADEPHANADEPHANADVAGERSGASANPVSTNGREPARAFSPHVGDAARPCATPVPREFLRPGLVVADAVYHPVQTQLIADASACGCTVVTGLGMLLGQAAASEAIWYDVAMPVETVERRLFG